MSEIINWLNKNAGTTSAILTAVYVIATIIIIFYNHKTVNEMKYTRKQEIKPQIVLSFETRRKGLLCLVVKNTGNSAAKNLKIKLSNNWIDSLPRKQDMFRKLSNASLILVPNQEFVFTLGGPGDFNSISKENLNANIKYTDIFDEENAEEYFFDFESYGGMLLYGPQIDELTTTIKKGFKDITKELNKISK